jgi:hypothetical protein
VCQISLNPVHCNNMNRIPSIAVTVSRFRYRSISRSLKDLKAICIVRLLNTIVAVEYQNALGIENVVHPAASLFTTYALVNPANIITMLANATHNVNL